MRSRVGRMQLVCLVLLSMALSQSSRADVVSLKCESQSEDGEADVVNLVIDMDEKISEVTFLSKNTGETVSLTALRTVVAPSQITIFQPGDYTLTRRISRKTLDYEVRMSGSMMGLVINRTRRGSCEKVENDPSENLI